MRNIYAGGRMYKMLRLRQMGGSTGSSGSWTREMFLKYILGVREIPKELVKK